MLSFCGTVNTASCSFEAFVLVMTQLEVDLHDVLALPRHHVDLPFALNLLHKHVESALPKGWAIRLSAGLVKVS